MKILERMPGPPNEPAPRSCVRIERPESGLALLVLDPPHRKLAVFDRPLMRDLELALGELESDGGLRGLVVTGKSPTSFVAGADIDAIEALGSAELASELARFGQSLFERLARLRAFKVAAVGGPVPGGAFELSLACDRIVLADHKSTRIGLPETRLGILPGWGGCQRLPRRVGVPTALAAILAGKLYVPREALKLGLVDRLCAPENLRRIACEIALRRMPCARFERGPWSVVVDRNPLARALIGSTARKNLRAQTKGHYPAPERALELVLAAPSTALERGFEREARALGELAVTPECKSLISIFRASEDSKKLSKLEHGGEARAIQRAGVIGAGVMGGAIAGLLAEKGVRARLADIARPALDKALAEHARRVDKSFKKRHLEPHEARAALDRLSVSSELAGLARCDLVLEAVAERLEVKRAVFGKVAEQVASDAILATNTSSLSVDAIAASLPHPERVIGLHFFNPVHMMPLVEIVRGSATSAEVVARTAKLALALGKTPVVVRDVAGFLVNRVLGPYLDEAVRLYELGLEPERIECAALDFGLPMGPLELLDEVGLDIAAHAAQSLAAAYGERMHSSGMVARMLAAELRGKKSGAGFFSYAADPKTGRPKKSGVNPRLAEFAQRAGAAPQLDDATLRDRLALALVGEAALCLQERVVDSPAELDLATVFGLGFPPFHGGALRYVRSRGADEIVATLARLAELPDVRARSGARQRFEACELLRELARAPRVAAPR
ncbi:MAG: enoyl-CoA hydratase/isomerase family protein [Planctomycetes bacterium]|nr:enoyl-CoA hydratase/isomerase family protein [Planctomycetota bacterium]